VRTSSDRVMTHLQWGARHRHARTPASHRAPYLMDREEGLNPE